MAFPTPTPFWYANRATIIAKGLVGRMKFAVLDFETTGNQPIDEIIQVGLVVIEDRKITDRYTSFVKPRVRIPDFISSLTGITDEMVSDAPSLEEVMGECLPYLDDCILVGHHIPFDLAFLQRALDQSGYVPFTGRVLDTIDLARILFPSLPSMQLTVITQTLGIPHERPHQADSDALATALVWLRLLDRLDELDLLTLQRIAGLFENETSDFSWFLQEMRRRREERTALDPNLHKYVRGFSLSVGEWGNDPDDGSEDSPPPDESFDAFLEQFEKTLEARFPGYERREGQHRMFQEVHASLEEEKHLLIEAGTGTGKSLGYLVPALYYGLKENKPIIVSTHTIQLQEQLRNRDIPLLKELLPHAFKVAVLKGRNHYLCLRKFEQKLNLQDFENGREDRFTAAQMVVWLSETLRGEDEELGLGSRGAEFWQTVASDADSCLNRHCPWFRRCFYHRAKNEANTANLVITNHSLLFTDMKAENRLLPSYQHLIVDEAHHFEEVASKHLGQELHYYTFVHTLTRLYKDSKTGLLPLIRFRLEQEVVAGLAGRESLWLTRIDELCGQLVQVKESWDELAALLYEYVSASNELSAGEAGSAVVRLKPERLPKGWDKVLLAADNLHLALGEALKKLNQLAVEWKDAQETYGIQGLVTDLAGVIKDLHQHRDMLHTFMKMEDPDCVYWMEANLQFKAKSLFLTYVPVNVSGILQQFFFNEKNSIIMTSATLSVDKTFDYTCEQVGLVSALQTGKLKTAILPSPFDFRQQALVVIPRDFPDVKGAGAEAVFCEKLGESLKDVAIATRGRMLVLFTSYRMLRTVQQGLKDALAPHGIEVLAQGVDSNNRSKLTKLFTDSEACVLLGTSSFWEGVDIPGEALSCLAIARLPFQPPGHPLVEAKCELIKQNRQNPFMKYSVPQAVIRFKQGFGRLIRTATDKGIVVIYDTRVIHTSYGRHFLYSLPGPKIESMSTAQLVPRIKEWMGGLG